MGLARLALAGERNVGEALLVAKVSKRRDHVALEVVPFEEELLLVLFPCHSRFCTTQSAKEANLFTSRIDITPIFLNVTTVWYMF